MGFNWFADEDRKACLQSSPSPSKHKLKPAAVHLSAKGAFEIDAFSAAIYGYNVFTYVKENGI